MIGIKPSPVQPNFSFSKYDGIVIGGQPHHFFETREEGHFFLPAEGSRVPQVMTNSEISRYLSLGKFQCTPNEHQPEYLRARILPEGDLLSLKSPKSQEKAGVRLAAVHAFQELLDDETKGVYRTEASIDPHIGAIKLRIGEILAEGCPEDKSENLAVPKSLSAKTVLRWERKYRRFGLAGLYDRNGMRGNRDRRLTPDELMIMGRVVSQYLDDKAPPQAIIVKDVRSAFVAENERRRAEGEPELSCPSRETVRQAIKKLNPFHVTTARKGRAVANNQFAPVGMGNNVDRPMQRVEFDEWEVDVISRMAEGGLYQFLTHEEKKRLGLDKKKARWWITVAVCVATRCVVGMVISRNPNSQSALRVIEMMMRDKGVWGDAVEALTPWNQFGWPSLIVTDNARYNLSNIVQARASDLGVTVQFSPAGNPATKAHIERIFGTFASQLMPRLHGRTFSNSVNRGDYDAVGNAVLNPEEFCSVLVRYIVDIYHRSPHSGLNDEAPLDCWNRLIEKVGVQPPPDLGRRRLIFGHDRQRLVTRNGITVLGVRYHSEQLARFMTKARERKVAVRWYPEDIGAIWVELDGCWFEIPAVFDRYCGVSAEEWLRAAAEIRAQNNLKDEVNFAVVRQAIDHIKNINSAAMNRVGLILEDWSDKRMEYEEDRLFIGFKTSETEAQSCYDSDRTEWGTSLRTAADAPGAKRDFGNSSTESQDSSSVISDSTQRPDDQARKDTQGPDESDDWVFEDK